MTQIKHTVASRVQQLRAPSVGWYKIMGMSITIMFVTGLIVFSLMLIGRQDVPFMNVLKDFAIWVIGGSLGLFLFLQILIMRIPARPFFMLVYLELVSIPLLELTTASTVGTINLCGIVNLVILYVIIMHYLSALLGIKKAPRFVRHSLTTLSVAGGIGVAGVWVAVLFPLLLTTVVQNFGRDTTAEVQSYQLYRTGTVSGSNVTVKASLEYANELVVKVRFAGHDGRIDSTKGTAGFDRLYNEVQHSNKLKVRYVPSLPDIFLADGELQITK